MRGALAFIAALLMTAPAFAASPARNKAEWASVPPWVTRAASTGIPAAVDLDFADGWYWDGSINALADIAVTRASPAEASGPDGTWFPFASGQLPATASGALIEEARTNSIRNNTMTGAATGVVGSGGTVPTDWGQVVNGPTQTIVSLTTQAGLSCITENLTGTTSGTTQTFFFEGAGGVGTVYGQTWTDSLLLSVSNLTNVTSVQIGANNPSATLLVYATISPTATLARYSGSYTLTTASATFSRPFLLFNTNNSAAVNFNFTICAPQFEQNSLINSTVASATVNAGGTGYTPSSSGTVTWNGSGCTTNPVLNVTTNVSGVVSGVTSVATAGSCTTFPSSSATTWTDGTGLGTGSGASFNLVPTNVAADAFATSPILTTSAAATRASTVATLALPAGATSTSGYALLGIGTPEAPTGFTQNQEFAQIDDGTSNNRVSEFRVVSTGALTVRNSISGTTINITPSGTWAQSAAGKLSAFASSNSIKGTFNNGTIASGSPTGLAAGINEVLIGETGGASFWNGTIGRLVVAPASLLAN